MNKVILSIAIMAGACTGAFSQQVSASAEKTFSPATFEKLVIDGNMNVVLKESGQPSVVVYGDPGFVNSFSVTHRKTAMQVRSSYEGNRSDKNVVIISVKNLKHILISQDANIISENTLQSPLLKVMLNATAYVKIKNNGNIRVAANDEYVLETE